MTIHELKQKFMQKRAYDEEDASRLLDFAKQAYIAEEISVSEYRTIIRELEANGAEGPFEAQPLS